MDDEMKCVQRRHTERPLRRSQHTHTCVTFFLYLPLYSCLSFHLSWSLTLSPFSLTQNIAAQLDVTMAAVATTLGLPRVP